jgi:hypothetical protein
MNIITLYGPFFGAIAFFIAALRVSFDDDAVLSIDKFGLNIVITKKVVGKAGIE